MLNVQPVVLERAPVRLIPLGLEHEEGLKRAAADGELWNLRVTSVPEPEKTRAYVEHRCAIAGAARSPFDAAAVDALYEMSRGNLRAIDALALEALGIAARAKATVVCAGHIVAARKVLWP